MYIELGGVTRWHTVSLELLYTLLTKRRAMEMKGLVRKSNSAVGEHGSSRKCDVLRCGASDCGLWMGSGRHVTCCTAAHKTCNRSVGKAE